MDQKEDNFTFRINAKTHNGGDANVSLREGSYIYQETNAEQLDFIRYTRDLIYSTISIETQDHSSTCKPIDPQIIVTLLGASESYQVRNIKNITNETGKWVFRDKRSTYKLHSANVVDLEKLITGHESLSQKLPRLTARYTFPGLLLGALTYQHADKFGALLSKILPCGQLISSHPLLAAGVVFGLGVLDTQYGISKRIRNTGDKMIESRPPLFLVGCAALIMATTAIAIGIDSTTSRCVIAVGILCQISEAIKTHSIAKSGSAFIVD